MAVVAGRYFDALGAHALTDQSVDGERMLAVHGAGARPEEHPADDIEHIVGAVAEDDLLLTEAESCRQRSLEVEPGAIGVAGEFVQRCCSSCHCRWAHAQGVFVARQLDDVAFGDASFAGELGNWFAGLVGRDADDAGQG